MIVKDGKTIEWSDDIIVDEGTPLYKNTFGYIPSPQDDRDYQYKTIKMMSTDLPSSYEVELDKVDDQGRAGACTGFGINVSHNSDAKVRYNKPVRMSPLFPYAEAKKMDRDFTEGTTIRNVMKVSQKLGVPEYDLYPYEDSENVRNCIFPKATKDVYDNANKHKIKSYAQVYTVEELKNAIYNENAVVAGFQVFETFMHAKDGFIGKIDGRYYGGHCVSFVGWDDNLERVIDGIKYKGFIKIQNSWGEAWGDKGFGYLAYDLFNHTTLDGWWRLLLETWTTVDDIDDNDPNVNLNYHKEKWLERGGDLEPVQNPDIIMTLGEKKAFAWGKEIELIRAPEEKQGVTLVPIRFITEAMGLYVEYKKDTREILIKGLNKNVKMKIGGTHAVVDGKDILMSRAPEEQYGVTLVPVRFIAEAFGAKVDYEHETKKIYIHCK